MLHRKSKLLSLIQREFIECENKDKQRYSGYSHWERCFLRNPSQHVSLKTYLTPHTEILVYEFSFSASRKIILLQPLKGNEAISIGIKMETSN